MATGDQQLGSIGQLRKVLETERRYGFANRAVFGGLDGFLENWRQETLKRGDQRWRAAVGSLLEGAPDYRDASIEVRQRWVERVLDDLAVLESARPAPGLERGREPVQFPTRGSSTKPASADRAPAAPRTPGPLLRSGACPTGYAYPPARSR